MPKRRLTYCLQWCRPHKYQLAPGPAHNNVHQRGLPLPSSSGSRRSYPSRCTRRRWPPYTVSGASTGKGEKTKTVKGRAQFTNTSLFEGSSSAKADGTQTVASQQTYCLWYMRATSCRKQPKSNPAPHRETILIQALLLSPGVLKTVSSPYLHKPNNLRLRPSYLNTDCVWVCTRWTVLGVFFLLVSIVLMYSVTFTWLSCSDSTELRFNLQRFIDWQYVLLFAYFIAASCFVADGGPLVNEMLLLLEMTCICVKLIISSHQTCSLWQKKAAFLIISPDALLVFYTSTPWFKEKELKYKEIHRKRKVKLPRRLLRNSNEYITYKSYSRT